MYVEVRLPSVCKVEKNQELIAFCLFNFQETEMVVICSIRMPFVDLHCIASQRANKKRTIARPVVSRLNLDSRDSVWVNARLLKLHPDVGSVKPLKKVGFHMHNY